jgi:uncharacterized protein YndB with AHSA1/START domain
MNDETKEESLLEWDKIELRRAIAGSCDDIWRYWAEPHLIKRWWGDSVHLELRVGGAFEERWKASDGSEMVTSGTVIICQPSRSFTLTWADDDWRAMTEVMVMFREDGQLTDLKLVHRGWLKFRGEKGAATRAQHAAAWERHLDALVALSESDNPFGSEAEPR